MRVQKLSTNHKNVIEINGKLYDAKSGTLLQQKHSSQSQGHSIDGVMVPKPHTIISPAQKPSEQHYSVGLKPAKQRSNSNNRHRSPQKSQILMRKAVRKPTHSTKQPEIASFTRQAANPARKVRAQDIARSPYIHKYSHIEHRITKRTENIAVVQPPTQHKAVVEETKSTHNPTHKAHHTSSNTNKSEKLFSDAMQKANTKTAKPSKPKKHRSKALRWGSSLAAVVLLVGFIAYMNLPNINLKLASKQAGFAAAMPNYQPAGYAFNGPVNSKPGQVTISFHSNTDERQYKVKQEVSSWNSQSLQENFLAAQNKKYTTTQEGGRTVYMYDNNNATWVNGGVWYQVESDSLSSEQLLNIASSM